MSWLGLNMTANVMVAVYHGDDVERAIARLNIDYIEIRDELTGHCPMHRERTGKEDGKPSWSINIETGAHHCFSCGYKGSLLSLVADVKGFKTPFGLLDFGAAKSWLNEVVEVDIESIRQKLADARDIYVAPPTPVPMSEARLSVFSEPPEWALVTRGVTSELCQKYSVKFYEQKSIWILPLRSASNFKLMGWQEKGQGNRHFFNRPPGIAKSKTLFGIDAWEGPVMVVVESPLDAVKVGVCRNSTEGVAICGAMVSEAQLDLMRKADKLILAFDNPAVDEAGRKALSDFKASALKNGIEFWAFNYGDSMAKDIGDMTPDEVRWGIDNAVHCLQVGRENGKKAKQVLY